MATFDIAADEVPTRDELLRWLEAPIVKRLGAFRRGDADDAYWTMHPRIVWLKNLPLDAVVLDVGAGDGGLAAFRGWPAFPRADLEFLGLSLAAPARRNEFREFHVVDLDKAKPAFSTMPTAVLMAHVIEHLRDGRDVLRWLAGLLPRGGRIFIEWPGPNTALLPSCDEFRSRGYPMTTLNFHDDSSHISMHAIADVIDMLDELDFAVGGAGYVDLPYLSEVLRVQGLKAPRHEFYLSMGMWLRTRFSSYVAAVKR